jgi:hypothetical protein
MEGSGTAGGNAAEGDTVGSSVMLGGGVSENCGKGMTTSAAKQKDAMPW